MNLEGSNFYLIDIEKQCLITVFLETSYLNWRRAQQECRVISVSQPQARTALFSLCFITHKMFY